MKPVNPLKPSVLTVLLFTLHSICLSQNIFFRSSQTFSKDDLQQFFASIALNENHVLFIAPDFKLYSYKKDGTPAWSAELGYKTNISPFIVQNRVWVNTSKNRQRAVKQFNLETGAELKSPGITEILTQPIIRNGIMYATGITDLGAIFAYDLSADSLIWQKFIAHGCSTTPYYREDRITANAEGYYWIDISYTGKMNDPKCEDTTETFPSELPCARTFHILTHDGRELSETQAKKLTIDCSDNLPVIQHYLDKTFILHCNQLSILGNKLKQKAKINLDQIVPQAELEENALSQILEIDAENIWIAYGNYLFQYNYKKSKPGKTIDLSEWEPHQVLKDGRKLWLISKKDGLLYGIDYEAAETNQGIHQ